MKPIDASTNICGSNTNYPLIVKKFILRIGIILLIVLFFFFWFYPLIVPGERGSNLSYDDWKKLSYSKHVSIPKDSEKIRYRSYSWIDIYYTYVEATIKSEDIRIEDFIQQSVPENVLTRYSGNVALSKPRFAEFFAQYSKPRWWNQKTMSHFNVNSIIVWQDPNDTLYGRGVGYFYSDNDRKLRVFTWGQQHLKAEEVAKIFLLEKVEVE